MADDDFDWNADWVPPKPVYMDDLLIVDPVLGKVPFWKSLIYNSARLRNAIERSDNASSPTPLKETDQPPRLAADEKPALKLTDADLKRISDAIDKLTQRLDAFEQRQRAERALLDAEEQIEKEFEKLGGSSSNDDKVTLQ
jgi:hypothetical protein